MDRHNPYTMTRPWVINSVLDAMQRDIPMGEGTIKALEIGRLRMGREVCGHSTLHIASHPAVARLTSIDISEGTERECRRFMPASIIERVEFVNGDGVKWLSQQVAADGRDFDFIYLDAANDPEEGRALLIQCLGVSHGGTIIVMDDTGETNVHKGDLAVPYARQHPDRFTVIDEIPKDWNCHGLTVFRVEGVA